MNNNDSQEIAADLAADAALLELAEGLRTFRSPERGPCCTFTAEFDGLDHAATGRKVIAA